MTHLSTPANLQRGIGSAIAGGSSAMLEVLDITFAAVGMLQSPQQARPPMFELQGTFPIVRVASGLIAFTNLRSRVTTTRAGLNSCDHVTRSHSLQARV